jgi:hypothetical protein
MPISDFALLSIDSLNIVTSQASFITDNASIEGGSSIQSSASIYLDGDGNDNITVSDLRSNSIITLAQFMSGSDATINGLNPSDFTLKYSDMRIGSGNELLVTASPNSGGNTATTIALPGYSTADIISGKLTTAFEPNPVTGAFYLLIHAN